MRPGIPRPGRRRTAAGAALCLLGLLASDLPTPVPAAAQVVRERPVPLDTAGTLLQLDAELRRSVALFPEVEGFRSARLFQLSSGGYVLEIELRDAEGVVRERRSLSANDVESLRLRVSAALADRPGRVPSREGRAGLLLTSTALGLGFYGWAVPVALDLEDRGALAAYLLTSGTSFFLPYAVTRNRPVTPAQRNAATWGGTRGIVYGLLLGDALTGGEEPDEDLEPEGSDEDVVLAAAMATSLTAGLLGYVYGGRPGVDEAHVSRRATAGDFALAWGFGTSLALGLYDGRTRCRGDVCETSEFERRPIGHLATAGLGAAGTWALGRWARARDHTVGDTRALRSFGLLGGQAVLPLAWSILRDTNEGERALAASLVLGSAAGVWVGERVLRDRQLPAGSGLLVMAGHAAGGLGALGVTYLFDDSGAEDEILYMTTSALGSLAGSWLTFRAVQGGEGSGSASDARARQARSPGASGVRWVDEWSGPRRTAGRRVAVELGSLPAALLGTLAPHPERRTDLRWVTVRF